jgi:hypothetical protein
MRAPRNSKGGVYKRKAGEWLIKYDAPSADG